MRTKYLIFVIPFFLACNNSSDIKTILNTSSSDTLTTKTSNSLPDTVLINNKISFKIKFTDLDNEHLVLSSNSAVSKSTIDTLIKNGLLAIEYPDFNKDGSADILIDYIGNNSTYFLYLFDTSTNQFIAIKDYQKFPDAIQLTTNNKYYYSYHRAGCADMDWVSDLFSIESFKIVHIGHIYGRGCADPPVINFYKIKNNDENTFDLIENIPYPDIDKWEFIKDYWNRNYRRFE